MGIAIMITAIVVILFNFFVLYKSFKAWKFFHLFALFLVFASSIVFCVYAAKARKVRIAWQKKDAELNKKLIQLQKQYQELEDGKSDSLSYDRFSLIDLKGILARSIVHQGSRWNDVTVSKTEDQVIFVTLPTPETPPEEGTVQPRNIVEEMVLQVFQAKEVDGQKIYDAYLGEFSVTNVEGNSITLAPTHVLDENQLARVNDSGRDATVRLALFEIMPQDSHYLFVDELVDGKKKGIYESLPTREQLVQLFPQESKFLNDEAYQTFLRSMLYDGRDVKEIKAELKEENATFEIPPERIQIKVEFLKTLTDDQTFDVDSVIENKNPLGLTYYDQQGLAIQRSLYQGTKTKFLKGETAIFNRDKATELINSGVCKQVMEIYVRPLRDFDIYFRTQRIRTTNISEEIAARQTNVNKLREMVSDTGKQVEFRTAEKAKLSKDLGLFVTEQEAITEVSRSLTEQRKELTQKMSLLYRANRELADQIAEKQRRLEAYIDNKTNQATAKAN